MLKRDARQGNPKSTFLFILALEISFLLLKTNCDIKDLETFLSYLSLHSIADKDK